MTHTGKIIGLHMVSVFDRFARFPEFPEQLFEALLFFDQDRGQGPDGDRDQVEEGDMAHDDFSFLDRAQSGAE